jgi:hypothetical protein
MTEGCVPLKPGAVDANGNQVDATLCPAPSDWSTCRLWELTTQSRTQCYIDNITQEALSIAGADVNLYKLLGVHEQTKLVDLTGDGNAISGGDYALFPASNAFTVYSSEWRSAQVGQAVLQSAYIGYDFGFIKISTGRARYGIDTSIRQLITTIKIKQGSSPDNRVVKARVERSDTGKDWYGVAIINLPDNDQLNMISFKNSVPSRYWRLRPIAFAGGACSWWTVKALELFDYMLTAQNNIQDKILMENRNRDYDQSAKKLKGYYDLVNVGTELSKFGIEIPTSTYQIKINFNACVAKIGRPVIIGDIIELPSETQYTPELRPIKRWLEVTDVTWDASTYTPGWQPTMLLVTTQPAMASEETQDIFGDLAKHVDSSGLFDNDDGNNQNWQDYSTVSQTVHADALTQVAERGSEGTNVVRQFSAEELETAASEGFPSLNKIGLSPRALYVEDAMPANNAPYTEGPTLPASATNGEYHRLVYEGFAKDVPARLYRYSTVKGRWIYEETDRRAQYNDEKAILDEYLTSPNSISARKIGVIE